MSEHHRTARFPGAKSGLDLSDAAKWTPPPREGDPLVAFSQNCEDVRLWRVFADVERGFYVDIGAGDPVEYSVTKLFYDHGWSGINIEPGPAFGALAARRARDINLRVAVAPEEGVRDFWVSSPHSGISTFYPETHSEVLPDGFSYERVQVECRPAWQILETHAARSIDFMSIDVEGAEADVIRSIDFEATRPTVIVVEAITPGTREPSHEAWESALLDADYLFAAFDGVNRFYVDSGRPDLVPVLAYPVSVLDGFVPVAFHETETALRTSEAKLHKTREALQLEQQALQLQRHEAESARQRASELQSELAAVYASRIWRAGTRIVTAANPLVEAATRLRGIRRVRPSDAYAATVAPRQAWHFPPGQTTRRGGGTRLLDDLVAKFGPPDAAVTPGRASELKREVRRTNWTDEEALLQKRFPWMERQAVIEADAAARLASRTSRSVAPTSSTRIDAARSVVVVDARCLQDPSYRHRGVGLHSLFALDVTRQVADTYELVLLSSAELPELSAEVADAADRIVSTPYELRHADVALFVQLSAMTANLAPTVPFLVDEDCKTAAVVYDFIPSRFPRAYLGSQVEVLTNRARIEALRHYDMLLPISDATAADCREILGEASNVEVTGVADPLRRVTAPDPPDLSEPFAFVPIGGDPRKNAAAAIAALAQHRRATGEALQVVVTGALTGGQEAGLKKLMRRLALPDEAVHRGIHVSEEKLAGLYKNADVVVVPSFAEGFSIPVAEAVLRDTPVVASDIPAHRELLGVGPWLASPADIESIAQAVSFVRGNRTSVLEEQRAALGTKSEPEAVSHRITAALSGLLREHRDRRRPASGRGRARLAVVSPFPPQRSGVADYTAYTFGHVSRYADVEVFSDGLPSSAQDLPVRPLSAEAYLNPGFDAVINVVGNSHFHFPILDLMGAYGGACIAHDNRMVEAYRHDRGDPWAADLISRPSMPVREEQLVDLVNDLDRLPSIGYDIIARQASPLIVHGQALADSIFHDTGIRPVVVPFVPYNVPSTETIDKATRQHARTALDLSADVLQIGTFGIVDRRTKGTSLIVAAMRWLCDWGIKPLLHLVGYAPATEIRAVRRLANELGISENILVHGHLPRAKLEEFLLAVDVAVQLRTSSRLSLSGGVADCIAFGVPTVTTENVANELEAPSFVTTCPAVTSSLLVAEAVMALRDRRGEDSVAVEAERRDYLRRRSADGYAMSILSALGLTPG